MPADGGRGERRLGDEAARLNLLRLLTWLSPAFPVGAFAWSHGLERAVLDGQVRDRHGLQAWLSDLLTLGSLWSDAVLFAAAHWATAHGDVEALEEIQALSLALAPSAERHAETVGMGAAFLEAARFWPCAALERLEAVSDGRPSYPVAVAAAAAGHAVPLGQALVAYIHANVASLVFAAVRLVPLGQRDALATLAAIEPLAIETAVRAESSGLDDLGSATILSDIASMRHEIQAPRLFRS